MAVEIQAYPSSNIDSFRSLTNPKFIFLDESDFWIRDEVDEVRDVVERYIGKVRSLHCHGIYS